MAGLCEGRVVIVTGAGRGIGRAHALEFAREGAKVVVNDLGVALDGSASRAEPGAQRAGGERSQGVSGDSPAEEVVAAIREAGGEAIAHGADVADWEQTADLVKTAIDTFGDLHVVVNNAGIVRDRMFVSCTPEEWDAVVRVHLRGHFCVARHAAAYWRERSKAGGGVDARIVNTSSGAGLQGSVGQSAYGAAKGGIATLTLIQAAELGRYGVTANAIAPSARTRMTEEVFADMMKKPEEGFDAMDPANVSPLVVWLGSAESKEVTGRVFEVAGGEISLADGWRTGPKVERQQRWAPEEVGAAMAELLGKAPPPQKVYGT